VQTWDTSVGDVSTREELAAKYGGSTYSGGIVPSRSTDNIFVFSDPVEGRRYGYDFDGPSEDGAVFYYTGQGGVGDHSISAGNLAVLEHREGNRALRLFTVAGVVPGSKTKLQRYVGEFRVDERSPYRREFSADTTGAVRSVVVFRLLPVGRTLPDVMNDQAIVAVSPGRVPLVRLVPQEVDSSFFTRRQAQLQRVPKSPSPS
jgi:hypothetical protein